MALEGNETSETSFESEFRERVINETPEAEHAPDWFKRTTRKIADAWFDPKSFEKNPGFYEKFGIKKFKKYAPTSGDLVHRLVWKKLGSKDMITSKSVESLKNVENFTRIIEATHLALIPLLTAEFLFVTNTIEKAIHQDDHPIVTLPMVVGLNILCNIYPIMLQRYNRTRLYKTILKAEKLEENFSNENNTDNEPVES